MRELAGQVFSPRDDNNFEAWSSVFMLQAGHAREQEIRDLLGEPLSRTWLDVRPKVNIPECKVNF